LVEPGGVRQDAEIEMDFEDFREEPPISWLGSVMALGVLFTSPE
jgi:hypothetical protein